jgi:hypothetical protein
MAKAVDSSTPTAIRPAERLASAAPMPPGTGMRLEATVWTGAAELARIRVDVDERDYEQEEAGLYERLGRVVDRACSNRLR